MLWRVAHSRSSFKLYQSRWANRLAIVRAMSTAAGHSNAEAGPSTLPSRFSLPAHISISNLEGRKELDKSLFDVRVKILTVRLEGPNVNRMISNRLFRQHTLDIGRAKAIIPDPSDRNCKLVRMKVSSEDELPEDVRELIKSEANGTSTEELVLGFDDWSTSEILNSILPKDSNDEFAPSSFTLTGHIGHVNLKEEWLPYKYLIAQVMLHKNAALRTVVNKLDQINAAYRFFDMEVLAGEPDMLTTVSESGCSFTFDFSKVYWNSRLQHEHERMIQSIQRGETVADVMAGVGPFAVPLAKKGCYVLGNDLNPESVKWMRKNQENNKVQATLRVTESDGREFIKQSVMTFWNHPFEPYNPAPKNKDKSKRNRSAPGQPPGATHPPSPTPPPVLKTLATPQVPQHFIMNLPDSALTFLDAFWGLYAPLALEPGFEELVKSVGLPLVHVYCFTRELDPAPAERDICERASAVLAYTVEPSMADFKLHPVRRVAPKKDMYCLTFRLPAEVAFATGPYPGEASQQDAH
ncbi:Met-10+ like-protein-domain-containing protein [Kockovaella imperatae]|uniref:tRNA (guanine(37)-N1)-methyltransferase n=1 Tax=Kockovaella imperatae TaxID=4999 RepID=A0A1Y1UI12_9TREE|nr:Met-10+ like-protein-domain-containing protein [Kockovaella imperatae]ORX37662.1 Met-10+ like-protein-domain-containing protein [Kockovaella imperatae]